MKRLFIPMGMLAILLGIISCGKEKPVELTSPDAPVLKKGGPASYTEYVGVAAPEVSNAVVRQVELPAQGNLTFYSSQASFDALLPDQTVVKFENSNVPPFSICSGRSFNSKTNNECFSPGAIPQGISFSSTGFENMVLLTSGFLGLPSNVVGPNFFAADLDITFAPGTVNLVGMKLYDPFGPATLDVEVYGPGNVLLGVFSDVLTGTTVPTFFGVLGIDVTFSRIRLHQTAGGGGELVDDVSYGLTNHC